MDYVILSWGFDLKETLCIHMLIEKKVVSPIDIRFQELAHILSEVRSSKKVHYSCVAHCVRYAVKSFYGHLQEFNDDLIECFNLVPNKEKLSIEIKIFDSKIYRYVSSQLKKFRKANMAQALKDLEVKTENMDV